MDITVHTYIHVPKYEFMLLPPHDHTSHDNTGADEPVPEDGRPPPVPSPPAPGFEAARCRTAAAEAEGRGPFVWGSPADEGHAGGGAGISVHACISSSVSGVAINTVLTHIYIHTNKPQQRPDVTAIWRALLLSPPGPGGRIGSNKKIHGPPRVSTTRGNKGVSPSPLYILISQQSACGMLLRSLDDSLRRLIELVDRLPSPTPAVLPASILAHSYLWHLSPPSSASASAPAPHLAGAVHLATLHAVRLEREGPAGGEWGGNGTDDADGEWCFWKLVWCGFGKLSLIRASFFRLLCTMHRPAHQPYRGLLHPDALAAHPVSDQARPI